MGNWAEITLDHGKISVTDFGRHTDLNAAGAPIKTLTGLPEDFTQLYGDFLMSDTEAGTVGPAAWSNITVSPNFPSVAQTIAQLYPQSGGKTLDGVFAMDVFTIAKLMQITGPVQLDGVAEPVGADNVAQFLLSDQYLLDTSNAARIDMLEEVALTTITRLLTSTLPAPPELADLLGPMAREGRLVGWSARPIEEDVFTRVNMAGGLPVRDGRDVVGVALNNAAGSKIDAYLEGQMTDEVSIDDATGGVSSALALTLTNTAPSRGLPDYVIGNSVGLPTGTSRFYLSFYTALAPVTVTVDGEQVPFQTGAEEDLFVSTVLLDVPSATTKKVVLTSIGSIDDGSPYRLVVRNPPLARPFTVDVNVNGAPAGVATDAAGMLRFSARTAG
jgi:hypothetical protein